jgi:hypothetical protein
LSEVQLLQQQEQHQQQHDEGLPQVQEPSLSPKECADMQQQLAAREAQLSRAAARLSELELSVAQLTETKAGGGCRGLHGHAVLTQRLSCSVACWRLCTAAGACWHT